MSNEEKSLQDNVDGAPTQLADMRPQIDQPLRVVIPTNAPERVSKTSQDAFIQSNAFSPAALSQTKKNLPELLSGTAGNGDNKNSNNRGEKENAKANTAISDFTVLAFSSKRSGKKDLEAMAYVSLGVIHDNQGDLLKAIANYKMYAELCEETGDTGGFACALNCLGVDYMLLANPPSDAGFVQDSTKERSAEAIEYLKQAIACHTKHQEIGPDAGGRFVAGTNLGLCLGMIGDIGSSAKCHQDSLRIAIKMQTLYGQSISVGNLGKLALIKNDMTTARTCFEQYLQLVQALLDSEAEVNAWKILAHVCEREENYSQALENLEQASRIAGKFKYMNELRRINCLIGIAKGMLTFDEEADALMTKIA